MEFEIYECFFKKNISCIANHICRTSIKLDKKEPQKRDVRDFSVKLKDLGIWSLECRLFCLAEGIHCNFSYIANHTFCKDIELHTAKKSIKKERTIEILDLVV